MAGLPPELDIDPRKPFNKAVLDQALSWIAGRLRMLEAFQPDWQAAVNDLRAFGLQRINEAIMPAYQRVMDLATFGFLKGDSTTALTVETGRTLIITIEGESQRELFTPTEFVTLTRTSTPDEWAICRVVSYDAATGQLKVTIEAAEMSPGEHSDWQVTATAGSVVAAKALLVSTCAAHDAAEAIRQATAALREATAIDAAAAMKAANDANTAALLIEGGPVSSINGETGPIQLDESYIPGLTKKLQARALKVDVSAALDKKADKSSVENSLKLKADKNAVEQQFNALAADNNAAHDNLYRAKADVGWVTNELNNRHIKSEVYTKEVANAAFLKAGREINPEVITQNLELVDHDNKGGSFKLVRFANMLRLRNEQHADLVIFQTDGNIFGSAWEGGHLAQHVANYAERARIWAQVNSIQDMRQNGWWEAGLNPGNWTHCPGGGVVTAWHTTNSAAKTPTVTTLGGRYQQFMRNGQWITEGVW